MDQDRGIRIGLIVLILLLSGTLMVLAINLVPALRDVAVANTVSETAKAPLRQEATSGTPLTRAHDLAEDRALQWTAEAVLVRVEANWYVTADWQSLPLPPVAWSFLYYAPSQGMLATSVVDDEQVLWSEPAGIPIEPRSLVAFPPAYGPELAWASFLGAGGKAFLEGHPDAQVLIRLAETAGGSSWTVTAFEGDARTQVEIDAQSGMVLSSE